jgi:hypothetical protein
MPKSSIIVSNANIHQNRFLFKILGRIKKINYLFEFDFFEGSVLGFSFWYTAYVNLLISYKNFIAPHSVRPLFLSKNKSVKRILY